MISENIWEFRRSSSWNFRRAVNQGSSNPTLQPFGLREFSVGLGDGQGYTLIFPGTEPRSLDLLTRNVVRKPTELYRLAIILCLKRRPAFRKAELLLSSDENVEVSTDTVIVHISAFDSEITKCLRIGMQRMPLSGDFCVPFGKLDNRQRQETQTTLTKYLFRNICILSFKSVPGRVQDKG